MTRTQLNRAVARATGDDCEVVSYRGFNLVQEDPVLLNEDLDALIADWERIEAEELTSSYPDRFVKAASLHSRSRRNRTRTQGSVRMDHKSARRRTSHAAH